MLDYDPGKPPADVVRSTMRECALMILEGWSWARVVAHIQDATDKTANLDGGRGPVWRARMNSEGVAMAASVYVPAGLVSLEEAERTVREMLAGLPKVADA